MAPAKHWHTHSHLFEDQLVLICLFEDINKDINVIYEVDLFVIALEKMSEVCVLSWNHMSHDSQMSYITF